jgi:hypothetical protein
MPDLEKIKLTVEYSGEKLTLELPQDLDMGEWIEKFACIASFLTFHPDTIKEYFYPEKEVGCLKTTS